METQVDIAIAGGGLTGCLLALVLQRQLPNASVLLLDQQNGTPRQDPRGLALALRTQQVLAEYGVWQGDLLQSAAIQHIHVSDANAPGSTRMSASQEAVPALGYVAMAGALQQQLSRACSEAKVEHWQGVHVQALQASGNAQHITLNNGKQVNARLLVVAEGSQSPTRELLGMRMREHSYEQVAVAAHISLAQGHQNVAYERFTAYGPAALLPLGQREAALVWCMQTEQARHFASLTAADQTRAVQEIFGAAPGRISACQYQAAFPLSLAMAERFIGHRSVVIGNACHTLHPVAGQGYNLGVRDILDLAQFINPQDPGAILGLNRYQQQREHDYRQIISLTHGLVALFSNQEAHLRAGRSAGLFALRSCSILSKPLMRKAMGFRTLW